jgi:type I restriction enzyme S subunit
MKQGWEVKKLGEVCEVIAGQSPEGKYYNDVGEGLPFYQGKKEFGEKYLGKPTTWTTKTSKEALKNDILMSVRAPVGPINFATEKICIGRGLAAIRSGKLIEKEFLFNFLLKHENEIIGNTGAVFNSINKAQIEAIKIPLPPLPEQLKIVRILDEVFAGISKAKEDAEKNITYAREIFSSYLNSVFANPGVDWEEKRLGEVSRITYGFTEKALWQDIGPRFLRITDIQENNVIWHLVPYCKISDNDFIKYKLFDGDIVFARTGATTGKSYLIKDPPKSVFASYLIKVQIQTNNLLPKFLYLFFQTKSYWDSITTGLSGSAQGGFNATKLANLWLPIPPLPIQQSIVEKLDQLILQTKKLESLYQHKLADLEELKKSVLQKAFNGELTMAEA